MLIVMFMTVTSYAYTQSPISSFPLREVKSSGTQKQLIVYVTGDGGWNTFSKNLCNSLKEKGFSVIALDAKKYFWDEKQPDAFTNDISSIATFYQKKWGMTSWVIVGYSFGADVVPFTLTRFDKAKPSSPTGAILLNPSQSTDFEIRFSDMLMLATERKYKVNEEIEKSEYPVLCIYPEKEKHKLPIEGKLIQIKKIPGDHSYNNDMGSLIAIITPFLKALN